ncbi:MAG: hypothetical protein CML03_05230 [Pseudooceanicola sp.]|nr:hypothetical protein [Pseudooceanicola sp.]
MKTTAKLLGAALMLPLLASVGLPPKAAQAQSLLEGDLSFELGRNREKSRNFKHIATSMGRTFDSGFGVQLDLAIGKYENVTSTNPAAALHLYYAPDDTWALGGFILGEDQRPGNYVYLGLEAAYETGPLSVEGYAAHRNDRAAAFNGDRYGMEVAYAPDTWSGFGLFGGAHNENDLPAGEKSIAYLGTDYRFDNNTEVALQVGRSDLKHTVASVRYQINFGPGSKFTRRHGQGVFDGY